MPLSGDLRVDDPEYIPECDGQRLALLVLRREDFDREIRWELSWTRDSREVSNEKHKLQEFRRKL